MHNERILVVDDDLDLLALIEATLKREGFQVTRATRGAECVPSAHNSSPDLILLDLMLPDKNGFDVLAEIQRDAKTSAVPVIILSARDESENIVKGLELGADDYIVKPFNKSVLSARVRSVLRRRKGDSHEAHAPIRLDGLTIDPVRHEVHVDGDEVALTAGEFNLLHLLARKRGAVLTRAQIIKGLHGESYEVTSRSVDVQLVGVRKKLGRLGVLLETVRGVGYRLRDPV